MKAPGYWRHGGLSSTLLLPLSAGFMLCSRLRRLFATAHRAPIPVICVGNLVAGGAGKTPVAIAVAARLATQGASVHFLSRGYGGQLVGPLQVDPGRHIAAEVGDEPLLLARHAPTWIARNRAAGADAAAAAGADVIVMDDGLQNPHLHKDVSLVVVDGGYGFGNGRVIPAGPLREPVASGLSRADAVVLMEPDDADVGRDLGTKLPVLFAAITPEPNDALAGQAVVAFAGIGRPDKFFATLEQIGCRIVGRHRFADHHPYRDAEITRLLDEAAGAGAIAMTTEKDHMRLSPTHREQIRALPITVEWRDPAGLDALLDRVRSHGKA